VESELDVQYAMLHPQLCGQGGNEVLADILQQSAAEAETYIVSGACAPEAQAKLFQKLLRKTGFDPKRFVPLDIRSTNNEGILARLKEKVEALAREHETAAA
jgi:heterodisulfide reductase subunit A-like polyferredoxin